jgi:hypothetical protein
MKAVFEDFISIFRKDSRLKELSKIANLQNWKFTSRTKPIGTLFQEELDLFKNKSAQRCIGVLAFNTKSISGSFRIYDLHIYNLHRTIKTTVFEYHNSDMQLSPFMILPKNKFSAFKELFVNRDFYFATSPEFDRNYVIKSFFSLQIKQELNEDFLDLIGDEAGWTLEGSGAYLIAYKKKLLLPIEELPSQIVRFVKICNGLINGVKVSNSNI